MRRFLATILVFAAALALAAAKENPKEARARAEARAVLQKYLDGRFRGAGWKDYRDVVMWSEEDEPPCTAIVRSYNLESVRLPEGDRALGTVIFYQLGSYCPEQEEFRPAPQLDTAVFQLRKRSILWLVEKSNRPGGHLDWKVLRQRLQQRLADPALPVAETARLSDALSTLERTANAIGATGGSSQQ